MRFSIWPINQQPLEDLLEVAQHAGATGWDGVWMADHLLPSSGSPDVPMPECWTALTLIAASVPGVRIGSLVMSATFRPVGLLAKMAATLASAHPGRLVLGLGAGWQANEHVAFGIPFDSPRVRLDLLEETCGAIRRLLDGEVTTLAGAHVVLDGAVVRPLPPERIPILVGAKGDRALGVVARHADEWNLWADPTMFRTRASVLAAQCERAARDIGSIAMSAQSVVAFTDVEPLDPRWTASGLPLLTGSPDQMLATLAEFRDAGLDEFVVPDFAFGRGTQRLEAMDRFVAEVIGPFRSA